LHGGLTYTQTFDAENRLIFVIVSGQTTQFIYNGDGQRIKSVMQTNYVAAPPALAFANANFTYNGDGQRVKSVLRTTGASTTSYL